jgi:predicted nucleotidyltransferase
MVTFAALQGPLRADILRLGAIHGARTIRVFGSVARGESGPASDVDFLVDFEPGRTLFDLIGLRLDLKDLLGVEVEIATPNSLRHLREPVLAEARAL